MWLAGQPDNLTESTKALEAKIDVYKRLQSEMLRVESIIKEAQASIAQSHGRMAGHTVFQELRHIHGELMKKGEQLFAELHIEQAFPEFRGVSGIFLHYLILARQEKKSIRERVIGHMWELARLHRARGGGREPLGTKLRDQILRGYGPRWTTTQAAIRRYNGYVDQLTAHFNPSWNIPLPAKLNANTLERPTEDHHLLDDVWWPAVQTPPAWVTNKDVRHGVTGWLLSARCEEEERRLEREAENVMTWWAEERDALESAIVACNTREKRPSGRVNATPSKRDPYTFVPPLTPASRRWHNNDSPPPTLSTASSAMDANDPMARQRTMSWLQDQGHDGRPAVPMRAAPIVSPPTPARATINAPPYRVPALGPRWSSPPIETREQDEELSVNSDVYDRIMGDADVVYEELGGAVTMAAERVLRSGRYADEEVEDEDDAMEDDAGWPAGPRSRCSSPPWPEERGPLSRQSSPPGSPSYAPPSRSPSPPWPEPTAPQDSAMDWRSTVHPILAQEAHLQRSSPAGLPAGHVETPGRATSTADESMENMLSSGRETAVNAAGTRPSDFFFRQDDWDEERVLEEVEKLKGSARQEATTTAGQPASDADESSRAPLTMGRGNKAAGLAVRPRTVFYGHRAPPQTTISRPARLVPPGHDSNDPFLLDATGRSLPVERIDWETATVPERGLEVGFRRLLVNRDMLRILHTRSEMVDDQIIDLFGHLFEEGQPVEWFQHVAPGGLPSVRIISPQALAELPYLANNPERMQAWYDRHFSFVIPRAERGAGEHEEYGPSPEISRDCIAKARQVVGIEHPGWAGWQAVDVDVVQQPNGFDCGLWVIAHMHSNARGFLKAAPHDMAVYKRALYDLLAGWPVIGSSYNGNGEGDGPE
ncbi:hypothetical protein CALCODRAFT_509451 [Calocera cornea HHB12733]|uniref:Ubiquitin-like protease family profile domain-containing protein n=1 Tax=Calocera cornea HHB12733 TaxID=1353952 RepID=A0A165FAS0_9BASI|nr:hypothetical protein CALCODRAFT_509451 [Calocera cornea HHB12733]